MATDFSIDIKRWEGPIHGSREVARTAAEISIAVDRWVATHADDRWAKSVRDEVFLSAYPLALWLADSWWRLRWESDPEGERNRTTSWSMAHELPAAGYGFLWPSLTFIADGETIDVICRASGVDPAEPIRYHENFRAVVPAPSFERAVDDFISTVLARLADEQPDSELRSIWDGVRGDRANPRLSYLRQLEARLGYDIAEAPEELLHSLLNMVDRAGDSAIQEVASGIAGRDPMAGIREVVGVANAGRHGRANQGSLSHGGRAGIDRQ